MSFLNGAFFIVVAVVFFLGTLVKLGSVTESIDKKEAGDAAAYMIAAMLHMGLMGWSIMAAIEWWAL